MHNFIIKYNTHQLLSLDIKNCRIRSTLECQNKILIQVKMGRTDGLIGRQWGCNQGAITRRKSPNQITDNSMRLRWKMMMMYHWRFVDVWQVVPKMSRGHEEFFIHWMQNHKWVITIWQMIKIKMQVLCASTLNTLSFPEALFKSKCNNKNSCGLESDSRTIQQIYGPQNFFGEHNNDGLHVKRFRFNTDTTMKHKYTP